MRAGMERRTEEGESGACVQVRDNRRLAGVQLSDTEAEWAGKGDG